ncbi:MAG: class I SAM-dependent methyltransferase [Thermodesulfobacteriota bacterium]
MAEPFITESDNGLIEDYGWNEPKTHAHNYLLGDLINILTKFEIPKTAQILDAGCGGGYMIHELYGKGYENIWGFDASKSGIEVSQNSFPEIKDRFRIHDAYENLLPDSFPDRNYDLVISVEVIEHLYSPKKYLENINRWLKLGGYLVITTPYHGYLKNLAISLINGFDFHFNPLWQGGHVKFFSKDTICKILGDTNFEPVDFTGSGRLPYLWKSMVIVAKKVGD